MRSKHVLIVLSVVCVFAAGCASQGDVVFQTVALEAEEGKPFEAGKAAAEELKKAMKDAPLKAVVLTECFEGEAVKKKALDGVVSVLGKEIVVGGSTYGAYTQAGSFDLDTVGLLGIGGDGIDVKTAIVKDMGAAGLTMEKDRAKLEETLGNGGGSLAKKLEQSDDDKLMIIFADAHSPKNGLFVNGVQQVMGKDFPITGGSVNKNAGQTFIYYGGEMYTDSAVGLLLSGDFAVSLAGRKADTNAKVVATAKDATAEALKKLDGKPIAMIAFDCAGRMGKLDRLEDELGAIQDALGEDVPLYGCYCAGEIGPADVSEKDSDVLSSGKGWHIMATLIGR